MGEKMEGGERARARGKESEEKSNTAERAVPAHGA